MQDLQRTLAELEMEEREMAAQRMSARTSGQQHKAAASQQNQQVHKCSCIFITVGCMYYYYYRKVN